MNILADTDNYLYLKADNRYVGRSIYIQICIYFLRAWLKKKKRFKVSFFVT